MDVETIAVCLFLSDVIFPRKLCQPIGLVSLEKLFKAVLITNIDSIPH